MKKTVRGVLLLMLGGAFLAPLTLMAQPEEKEKKKEGEQIIITRTGNTGDKVVIEVDGDKVLINGKPASEYKGDDVKVNRTKIKDVWAFGGRGANAFAPSVRENFMMLSADSNRAMLGVTTEKGEQGAEVASVTENSAAEKAGLKKGDIITKVGDKSISSPDDLSKAIREKKVGDKIEVTYLRDKKEQKTNAELGKWNGPRIFSTAPGGNFNFDFDGMDIERMMPKIPEVEVYGDYFRATSRGPKLGLSVQDTEDGKGVSVIDVEEDGSGGKAGIKEGDIITEVDGKAVNSADEVAKVIKNSKDKASVSFKLKRNGKTQTVDVKIPRKLKKADL